MKIADGEPSPLVAKGICKNYGGAPVLKDVDFSLGRGEIHALLGANGAGKSTLMNILDGVVPSNAGSIFINGIEARITNPEVARQHGIGMVHQELTVLPNITVAENIYINRLPRNRWGIVNWKKLYADTEKVLRSIGLDVNPRTRLGKLSIADRQMVEIGRIMAMDLPILLLDEPTSALSEAEIRRLLELILQFKSEGKSVVFITHKLDEIMAVSDKVTVLRDGKLVDVIDVCERDKKAEHMLVSRMIGEGIFNESEMFPRKSSGFGEVVLKVEGLSGSAGFRNIDFYARKGEIVGITGLKGSKRTELMRAVFGADRHAHGKVWINGVEQEKPGIANSIKHGVAMIPEDRKREGLVPLMSVKENISLVTIRDCLTGAFIRKSKLDKKAKAFVSSLGITVPSVNAAVRTLSGGNQQKVVLSKWLAARPEILIMDEPTRGIDIKSKMEIYRLIRQSANRGASVVFVSSEIPEAMGLADRLYVMREGAVVGELTAENFDYDTIMHMMFGHRK